MKWSKLNNLHVLKSSFQILTYKPDDESGDLLCGGRSSGTCRRSRGTKVGRSSWLLRI